jgi:hypothetical protein
MEDCKPFPIFASFTLAFALQLRKKHGKTSVRVRKTSVRVQYTYYKNTHTLQNLHTHTCPHITKPTHTHPHITKSTHTHTHAHTLQSPHTHPHITKQYKTTIVQIKTNTVLDTSK